MPNPTCSTCRWFEFWHPKMAPGDDDDEGDCRRFPETKQTFGCCSACGEHSPRPEAREGLVQRGGDYRYNMTCHYTVIPPPKTAKCATCAILPLDAKKLPCRDCRWTHPDYYELPQKETL